MKFLKILIIIFVVTACKNEDSKPTLDNDYISKIDAFFVSKMEERQNDYLQLVALYKLDSTENSFGKDESNNLSLKIDALPPTIGNVTMNNKGLTFNANTNIEVKTKEDSLVTKIQLKLNQYGSSKKLYHNQLSWQIITRSKQHYLRIWDAKNPAIEAFNGYKKFELSNDFIIESEFVYYEKEKAEIVKAEVDGKRSINFIGKASFKYLDKTYNLDVGADGFTMVGDATTGETTYGGGRYMYIDLPKENGLIKIDFNKLYNPPCAFSEFTTCLYPPRQNHMPFEILAGETITPF